MSAEIMFLLGMVLLSPALFNLFRLAVKMLRAIFITDDRVVISYLKSDGEAVRKVVHLDDSDDIMKIVDEVKILVITAMRLLSLMAISPEDLSKVGRG